MGASEKRSTEVGKVGRWEVEIKEEKQYLAASYQHPTFPPS
jgi:hypothetical protein